jgi:hypothetical protein
MKALKILLIVVVVYAGIVAAFESLIGFMQPQQGTAIVITTFDADKTPHDRVVSKLEADGKTYIAANHWPRAWYRRVLANPEMQATIDGEKRNFTAVPVTGAEHDRVNEVNKLPIFFRILTGFPPRYFVRLDPRA